MTAMEFAQTVARLPVEQQNAFLARLRNELTEDEYKTTAQFIALFAMYHNPAKYHAMKNAVRDMMLEKYFGHPHEGAEKPWYYEDPCNPVYMTTIV